MQKASVSILKAHLSRYLAAVKSGEEVVVTEHGRPIARLTPIGAGEAPGDRLAMLIREGRVRPPTREGPIDLDRPRPRDPAGLSLQFLLEEREQGR
jgi:prevent-host-death family protein